ncbi:helix-turn-helix transcriptional regulator [Pelagibius sp. Alg239-R121]|uniref:ArsR/SmtB family transcription factor n=1 Tax=Pelagibius sp. Alg239-R121 TaxID=2993448 RepID=UPI0024A73BCA|nr:helix-turn-helix transcriptional regulator [Pelagibius sp. Alg239-R121]
MKEGPDIALVAASFGEPARANMLLALMSGMALTATELAREAGVTPATASGHLSKLDAAGLTLCEKQGRHRFYRLADPDVAHAVEALVTVAARVGHMRTRPGPRDEAMRHARSCYDHLAGHLAVDLFARWSKAGVLKSLDDRVDLTERGYGVLADRGIDLTQLAKSRRPLCRRCIDWSERRHHLGGGIGAAVLSLALANGWAQRKDKSRVVSFTPPGEKAFVEWYSI